MGIVLASQGHSKLIVSIPSVWTSKNNTEELETIQTGASGTIYGLGNQLYSENEEAQSIQLLREKIRRWLGHPL